VKPYFAPGTPLQLHPREAGEDGASGRRAKNLTEKIAALKERKTRHEGLLKKLERSGESQVSLPDPDSRAMAAASVRTLVRRPHFITTRGNSYRNLCVTGIIMI
jgi:hypothetical protein